VRLSADQLEEARLEHGMFVRFTEAADAGDVEALRASFEDEGWETDSLEALAAQEPPAAWAREYGAALLETVKALSDENAELRARLTSRQRDAHA